MNGLLPVMSNCFFTPDVIFRGLLVCLPLISLGAQMEDDDARAKRLTQEIESFCHHVSH